MTRYYYDCTLKAAYMAKYFGMMFCDEYGASISIEGNGFRAAKSGEAWDKWMSSESSSPWYCANKAYTHPDSEGILKPKVDDAIEMAGEGKYRLIAEDSLVSRANIHLCFITAADAAEEVLMGGKIIQRNGIPFMWPEVEELIK